MIQGGRRCFKPLDFLSGNPPFCRVPDTPPDSQVPGSLPLEDPKHEQFALFLAEGEVPVEDAYRKALRPRGGKATLEMDAVALAQSPHISLRLVWLRAQVEERARGTAAVWEILSITDKRRICAQIAREGEKDSDRLRAIQVDNDLAGDGTDASKELVVVVKIGGAGGAADDADD